MRYNPVPAKTAQQKTNSKRRIDAVAKKVAIAVAFISVFIWFFKIIFL